MEPSALHSQINLFEARNTCLDFALGLVAVARRFDQALQSAEAVDAPGGDEEAPDDRALYFALGLVALSRQLNRVLDAERKRQRLPRRRATRRAADPAQTYPRDLLL